MAASDALMVARGAVSSERSKILVVDTSPRALELVSSADAAELVSVGAACPDHLVHTKRVPLWVSFDPELDDAETLVERLGCFHRPVARIGRAPVSKTGCWGFESLLACQSLGSGL